MSSNEWKDKSAVINAMAALREYQLSPNFILNAINSGQLDFRQGTIKGKPYIRVIRGQLEWLISQTPEGAAHLARMKARIELKEAEREISYLNKRLTILLARKASIEASRRFL